ncbi:MAG: GNAT family N-acetyltransferase [bacterium]|nr:GNAT family N-acetyltransferase [bacterium]
MTQLKLEPWTVNDRAHWRRLNNDPRVVRHMGDGVVDRDETERLFGKILELAEVPDERFLGLWAVRYDAEAVGMAELKHTVNTAPGEVEIIYALVPDVWGRGVGTQLVQALQDVASGRGFDVLATVHPRNDASPGLLRKTGIRRARAPRRRNVGLRLAARHVARLSSTQPNASRITFSPSSSSPVSSNPSDS